MQPKNSDFELQRKFFMQVLDCYISYFYPARGEYLRSINPYLK